MCNQSLNMPGVPAEASAHTASCLLTPPAELLLVVGSRPHLCDVRQAYPADCTPNPWCIPSPRPCWLHQATPSPPCRLLQHTHVLFPEPGLPASTLPPTANTHTYMSCPAALHLVSPKPTARTDQSRMCRGGAQAPWVWRTQQRQRSLPCHSHPCVQAHLLPTPNSPARLQTAASTD